MQRAYGVMDWNVTGGPSWIRSDRFDVAANARVAGNLTERQLQPMLQALLAERFKLKLRKSSKEMPGYALVVTNGGPKFKISSAVEEDRDSFRMNAEGLNGQAVAMDSFARFVAGKLGLVAVDQTGLKGLYDFKAHWKAELDQSSDPHEALQFTATAALQDQLGLKLVPKRIPVQLLVIDHAEKASASEN